MITTYANRMCLGSLEAVPVELPGTRSGFLLVFADPFELSNSKLYGYPWKIAAPLDAPLHGCRHRNHVHTQTVVERLESKAVAEELAKELLAIMDAEKISCKQVNRSNPAHNLRLCYILGKSEILARAGRNYYCRKRFVIHMTYGDGKGVVVNPTTCVGYRVERKNGKIWIIPGLTQPLYESGMAPVYDVKRQEWGAGPAAMVTNYTIWEKKGGKEGKEWRMKWCGWWTESEAQQIWKERIEVES